MLISLVTETSLALYALQPRVKSDRFYGRPNLFFIETAAAMQCRARDYQQQRGSDQKFHN